MKQEQPKIQRALALVDAGATAWRASQEVGIQASAVYRAIKIRKLRAQGICIHCGGKIKAKKK